MKTENEIKTETIITILSKIEEGQALLFSIDVLNISPRFHRTLLRNGTNTISDLIRNWEAVPKFRNMGITGVQEITNKLDIWYQQGEMLAKPGFFNSTSEYQGFDNKLIDNPPSGFDERLANVPVEKLDIPNRVYYLLKDKNINTVGQIYTEWEIIGSHKYIGRSVLRSIQDALFLLQNAATDQKISNSEDSAGVSFQDSTSKPSLSSVEIDRLDITQRAYSLLKKNNIHTVEQITRESLEELRSKKIIGSLTIGQIKSAVQLWASRDKKREEAYSENANSKSKTAPPKEISFDDYLNDLLGLLKPRYISIIEFRYGLRTSKKTTLQGAAKHFGVTRERIRQIESLAVGTIQKQLARTNQSPLFEKIRQNVDARGGLISESRLIDELERVFIGTAYSVEGIMGFINKMFDGEINLEDEVKIIYMPTLSSWSTSSYDKDQILHAINKILEILETAELPLQWVDLFSTLITEDGLLTLDEHLAHAVALCMSDVQKIQRQIDGSWSKFEKNTRYNRIIYIMRQIGQPAHFSEITEIYNQTYTDSSRSEHNIHSVLSSREEFVRVGQGKYGLLEWGLHDDGNVSNAVLRILANHKFPMSLADITDEVLKTWDVQNSAVISAIDGDARFSKTEDGKFWLTETGLTLKKRIKRDDDTRWNRLLIVLRGIGKPLSINLIVEAHNNSYPQRPLTVSAVKHMMYRKPELFIRTGREEFGLAEWGLQSFQDSPADRSKEILKIFRQKSPLHIDEVCRLYNEYHPEKQVGLITIRLDLRKLSGVISSSDRGIYKIIDETEIEIQLPQHDERFDKILKIFIEMNRPSRVPVILERYNQLYPADSMTLEGFMEYLMYAKNHPEKYSSLFEGQQRAS